MKIFESLIETMKEISNSLYSFYTATQSSGEGLPYWIFWLLLSLILLLIVFIFLRDKDLRRKMDHFFFRTKKKLIRMRHQRRLTKECRKKEQLIKDLGRKAWEERIDVEDEKQIFNELLDLEDRKKNFENELSVSESKITSLSANLEKSSKKFDSSLEEKEEGMNPCVDRLLRIKEREKEIESQVIQKQSEFETVTKTLNSVNNELSELGNKDSAAGEAKRLKADRNNHKKVDLIKKKENIEQEIKSLVDEKEILEKKKNQHIKTIKELEEEILKIETEKKHMLKEIQKEIKEWEKNKSRISEKIIKIERDREPLFANYGILAEEKRIDNQALEVFYSQITRSSTRIEEIEKQIEALE